MPPTLGRTYRALALTAQAEEQLLAALAAAPALAAQDAGNAPDTVPDRRSPEALRDLR